MAITPPPPAEPPSVHPHFLDTEACADRRRWAPAGRRRGKGGLAHVRLCVRGVCACVASCAHLARPWHRARMSFFGYDIELTSSERGKNAVCEYGGHKLVLSEDRKSAEPSALPHHHFNERCIMKGAKWSQFSTDVHGITEAELKESGARDHLVVRKAFWDWVEAQTLEDHPDGSGVAVVLTHSGESCDLDMEYHYARRFGTALPGCVKYYGDTLQIVKGSEASHPYGKKKYKGAVPRDTLYVHVPAPHVTSPLPMSHARAVAMHVSDVGGVPCGSVWRDH